MTRSAAVENAESLVMKDRCLTVQVEISTGSAHAILRDHAQSCCEICSQASVGGKKNSIKPFHRTSWTLSTLTLISFNFCLLSKIKTPLKGYPFQSRNEIMKNVMVELNTIPKDAFQKCFREWKECWAKSV
ncbi:hypothetical protein TNCV_3070591 [Trichonephila clavipes]|nr:hypothetical protein TNCV_3070591 [Trichonephila clavipes]